MLRLIKCKVMIKCSVTFLLLSCCSSSICRSLSGSSSSDCKTKMKRLNTQNRSISPIETKTEKTENKIEASHHLRVEDFQLRPQVPGLVFQPLHRHLQVLLGQVRLEKDIFFPPTFSSSSDSKKAFLSIAAFILPSKSSKLRMFQLGKIFLDP